MLSEEKKAIERIDTIQDLIIEYGQYNADIEDVEYFSKIKNLIEKQQAEIEKKNEIIELMGEELETKSPHHTSYQIIKHFTEKVEKIEE